MWRVEFTIEPFVEGRPGRHVTEAIDAARAHVGDVSDIEVGPFGTTCEVGGRDAGALVAAVTDAAVANGATHVSLHVERVD